MILMKSRVMLAALILCTAMAAQAQARVFIGFGVPLFLPPVVIGPPAWYGPPPRYYEPPGATFSYIPQPARPQSLAPAGGAEICQAGRYACPLEVDISPGDSCYCPGHNGRKVWGRAN